MNISEKSKRGLCRTVLARGSEGLIVAMAAICMVGPAHIACAEEKVITPERICSLTIHYLDNVDGTDPIVGAEFTYYRVAEYSEEVFGNTTGIMWRSVIPIDGTEGALLEEGTDAAAIEGETLESYAGGIPKGGMTGTMKTDSYGNAHASGLLQGIYLIRETKSATGHLPCVSFLMAVPFTKTEMTKAEMSDAGATNVGATNSGATNPGATNAETTNAGGTNTGATNAGTTNAGGTNTGATNTGATNTGATNAGATNAGATNADQTNINPADTEPGSGESVQGWCYEAEAEPKPQPCGELMIEKMLRGNGADSKADFHFKVILEEDGPYPCARSDGEQDTLSSGDVVTLKGGESLLIGYIPVGGRYKVTEQEANQDGYVTTETGTTGRITRSERARALFVNEKNKPAAPTSAPPSVTSAPTRTPTPVPTSTPTKTPTPVPTSTPGKTPTPAPTSVPSKTPTPEPTSKPAATPTPSPTAKPKKENASSEDETGNTESKSTGKSGGSYKSTAVKTGDESEAELWFILCMISAAGAAYSFRRRPDS